MYLLENLEKGVTAKSDVGGNFLRFMCDELLAHLTDLNGSRDSDRCVTLF